MGLKEGSVILIICFSVMLLVIVVVPFLNGFRGTFFDGMVMTIVLIPILWYLLLPFTDAAYEAFKAGGKD